MLFLYEKIPLQMYMHWNKKAQEKKFVLLVNKKSY